MTAAYASPPAGAPPRATSRRRTLFWLLYLPYVWLVFVPFLVVSTLVLGTAAVILSMLSKRLAFHCGTVWAWCLCAVNFTRVRVSGREHVRPGRSYVIMSNHQSLFDALALYGHWQRQFRWVMKKELRRVPGLGWGCATIGHVFIDRSSTAQAIASLRACRALLEGGVSVMFFPEGTRSRDGRMGRLKKGGFILAMELGLPILPVSISGSRNVLPNRTMRLLPGAIALTIHAPVHVQAFQGNGGRSRLMAEVASAIASGLLPDERPVPGPSAPLQRAEAVRRELTPQQEASPGWPPQRQPPARVRQIGTPPLFLGDAESSAC